MKLLLRFLVNYIGLGVLFWFFGWPLFFCPGGNTLNDLERATGTGKELHLMCWQHSTGERELLAEQISPLDAERQELQLHLAGTLLAQRPEESFVAWTRPRVTRPLRDDPLLCAMIVATQVLFGGLIIWINPIGRLWRANRRNKLLVALCLTLPGVSSLPRHWQDDRLRWQISEVVDQPFQLLWTDQKSGRGLVVVLRHHPADVERQLFRHLQLRAQDRLAVTYCPEQNSRERPTNLAWFWTLELLGCSWLAHRWTMTKRGVWL